MSRQSSLSRQQQVAQPTSASQVAPCYAGSYMQAYRTLPVMSTLVPFSNACVKDMQPCHASWLPSYMLLLNDKSIECGPGHNQSCHFKGLADYVTAAVAGLYNGFASLLKQLLCVTMPFSRRCKHSMAIFMPDNSQV